MYKVLFQLIDKDTFEKLASLTNILQKRCAGDFAK